MDYRVDLDPTHAVIRLTVTAEVMTPELAEDLHIRFGRITPSGGPVAAILDLSGVTSWRLSANEVRKFALDDPAVAGGRTHVVVARELAVFGMSRMFQQYRDFFGEQYQVVHSLEEAYDMVGVRPEDFTKRLYPHDLAA